jgi:prevent-host-death family protein
LERERGTVTASEAGKNLFSLIEKVNNDRLPVEITSKRGSAILISLAGCHPRYFDTSFQDRGLGDSMKNTDWFI